MVKNVIYLSVLIGILSVYALKVDAVYDPGQTPVNEREQSVPNQLIVKFKKGYDPGTLKYKIDQRNSLKRTFLGKVKLMFMDVVNPRTPEKDLQLLNMAHRQAGVINLEDNPEDTNISTYLLNTDGKKTYQQMESIYKKLPQVEY